ncbi:hypothetical protein [Streptomyces nigrescens]
MDEAAFLRRLNSALPKEHRYPIPASTTTNPQPRTRSDVQHTLETLKGLTGSGYAHLVHSHTGREHDELWQLLLDPTLIRRTHAALARKRTATLRRLQEPRGRQANERTRGYLELIETRLQQVESLLGDDVYKDLRNTINRLAAAIGQHRTASQTAGVIPEDWDRRLWDVLDAVASTNPDAPPDRIS